MGRDTTTNLDLLFDAKLKVCKQLLKTPAIVTCLNQEESMDTHGGIEIIRPEQKILPYLFDDTSRIVTKQSFIMVETFLQEGYPSNLIDSFYLYLLFIVHKDIVMYNSMVRLDYLISESNKAINKIDGLGIDNAWVRQVKLYQMRNPDYHAKQVTYQIDSVKSGICNV